MKDDMKWLVDTMKRIGIKTVVIDEKTTWDGVYGPMCRDPKLCKEKGYCPLDPTCAD